MFWNKIVITVSIVLINFQVLAQAKVSISWDKPLMILQSIPTLQVVVNPSLRRGSNLHDSSFNALKILKAEIFVLPIMCRFIL